MPRHIDADALKEKVRYSMLIKMGFLNNCADMGHEIDAEYKKQILANIDFHKAFIELIDKQPTIEAQPKTGKWIDVPHTFLSKCSSCEWLNDIYDFDYCPQCGCCMLKEGEEHETD